MKIEHNLTFVEIVIRYILMMLVMIAAGIFQSIPLIILGVAIFMTAISAYCPIYQLFGRKGIHTE